MIMMLTSHNMLIACLTVMQQDFAGQAGFNKQFECAIDSGIANTRIAGFNLKVQFFNTDVLMGGEKNSLFDFAGLRLIALDWP